MGLISKNNPAGRWKIRCGRIDQPLKGIGSIDDPFARLEERPLVTT
jgi:hypothetical protein